MLGRAALSAPPPQDEAVTPVVGTILMIAITVVLASVGLILFSQFNSPTPESARIGLLHDETQDRIVIVTVPSGSVWSDFSLQLSVAGDFDLSTAVSAGPDALPAGEYVVLGGSLNGPPDGPVTGGGFVSLCAEPGPAEAVTATLRHKDPGTLVWTTRFRDLADCPT